ncbi:MFS general substrate transporter [Ceraceosorus guamensis]|uniref:MFS general substrate transporter n=1 Tax=Ceraceosorus guamensis TaxID=1522189 RepID=A0A316VVJ5_9BASI|nr:MFS general substrate transporter [Ceraceosorus guamensis]PWN41479.1 MFS general substrate transporter [Ceraceosorus guamensis]
MSGITQPTAGPSDRRESVQTSGHNSTATTTAGEQDAESGKAGEKPSSTGELPLLRTLPILCLLILSLFLVSLDRTIIGVAIPRLTDDFHSPNDIGWYGSAYMLTNASLQLIFGRLCKHNPVKPIFLSAMFIFAVGSAVCGATPNSVGLILGRAIAGAGASGILQSALQIILHIVPLHKRPMIMAMFGVVIGASSALGPLIGGAFTQKVSWRWCFYINVPCAALAILIVALLLRPEDVDDGKRQNLKFFEQIKQLDPLGFILIVPATVALLLALQFGGFAYAWSNARVVALLVIFGVFFLAFVASQWYAGDRALIPPRVFLQRTVYGSLWYTFCLAGSMNVAIYYIPIWFQAVKQSEALHSSYQTLPVILSLVVASILSGAAARRTGHFGPQLVAAPVLASVGMGLISLWTTGTAHPEWIGFQVLYGFGIGLGMQSPSLALQSNVDPQDLPLALASNFFSQQMGGAIFVSVAQNLLANKLKSTLAGVEGLNASVLAKTGVTELAKMVPASLLPTIINAYNVALRDVWYAGLGTACAIVLALPFIKWQNLKKVSEQQRLAQDAAKQDAEKTQEA